MGLLPLKLRKLFLCGKVCLLKAQILRALVSNHKQTYAYSIKIHCKN